MDREPQLPVPRANNSRQSYQSPNNYINGGMERTRDDNFTRHFVGPTAPSRIPRVQPLPNESRASREERRKRRQEREDRNYALRLERELRAEEETHERDSMDILRQIQQRHPHFYNNHNNHEFSEESYGPPPTLSSHHSPRHETYNQIRIGENPDLPDDFHLRHSSDSSPEVHIHPETDLTIPDDNEQATLREIQRLYLQELEELERQQRAANHLRPVPDTTTIENPFGDDDYYSPQPAAPSLIHQHLALLEDEDDIELLRHFETRGLHRFRHHNRHANLFRMLPQFSGVDVDAMSYEELLALGDQIGHVKKGVEPDALNRLSWEQKLNEKDLKNLMEKEEGSCGICLDDYEVDTVIRRLNCFHTFHKYCIDHWFKDNRTCPICKQELS